MLCTLALGQSYNKLPTTVADPGFPVGGHGPRMGGRGPPRQLRFENFACQNERIWTHRGARAGHAPLDPPMNYTYTSFQLLLHK